MLSLSSIDVSASFLPTFPYAPFLLHFPQYVTQKPLSSLFYIMFALSLLLCDISPATQIVAKSPDFCEIRDFLLQVGTPDPLPNWRQVPGFPVFGLGQPTEKGLTQVSGFG